MKYYLIYKYINKNEKMYKENHIALRDCAFFMGAKGSTTGWHCDIDGIIFIIMCHLNC